MNCQTIAAMDDNVHWICHHGLQLCEV